MTTEPWAGGNNWAYQQSKDDRKEGRWKSIKVLDASDLQSWIEEWLGVQTWLMDRMGFVREGFQWLRSEVEEWGSVAHPALTTGLHKSSVERHFTRWHEWLGRRADCPLTIVAESLGEARLFVQALLEEEARTPPERPIEGLCVSTEEALRRLLSAPTSDVVVIPMNNDVRELAIAHCRALHVALPVTGNPRVPDPLIVSPAGFSVVENHMVANRTDTGHAAQIARACGGSITVLRRLIHVAAADHAPFQIENRLLRILGVLAADSLR